MRLFISIGLPKKERTRIHSAARPLREHDLPVRWNDPDDYLVLLKDLGEVRKDRIDEVAEVMESVAAETSKFPAAIEGYGAFPTIRRPELLWAGLGATPELRCLKQDLEWGLAELGFPRETRAFHPHVTLGRATGDGGAGAFRGVDEVIAELPPRGEFVVHTIDLARTRNPKSGSRFEVLRTMRLSGD